MQEDHYGPVRGHVVMNRDHLDTVLAKRLQNRGDFAFEHSYIACDNSILLRADERGPGVQTHPGVDGGAVLFHPEVVAPHGDFVDRAGLLTFVPHDLGDFGGV